MATGPLRGHGRKTGMSRNSKAQMPFTMVAVCLIVLSGVSMSLMSQIEDTERASIQTSEELRAMEDALSSVESDMESACRCMVSSLADAGSGGQRQSMFEDAFGKWSASWFPASVKGFKVELMDSDLVVSTRHMTLAGEPSYSGSLPSHNEISGNVSIRVSSLSSMLEESIDLYVEDSSSVPFLEDRSSRMLSSMRGSRSELMQMISYELGVLAQNRALRGWGISSCGDGRSVSDLITEEDVIQALDISLSMLELENFRSMDPDDESLNVISDHALADPAAILLGRSWNGTLEMSSVLSQSLASLVDLLVLRWLDYLHIVDVSNVYDALNDGISNFIDGAIVNIMGPEWSPAVKFIRDKMSDAGMEEYQYRYAFRTDADLILILPETEVVFHSPEGQQSAVLEGATVQMDLPTLDIFQWPGWEDFTADYRRQTNQLIEYLRSFIMGVCEDVASSYGLGTAVTDIDPFSGRTVRESMTEAVMQAMERDQGWLSKAIEMSVDASQAKDSMAGSLSEYMAENRASICSYAKYHSLVYNMVWSYYKECSLAIFPQISESDLCDLQCKVVSGGYIQEVCSELDRRTDPSFSLITGVLSSASSSNPLQKTVSQLARFGLDNLPGMADLISGQMVRTVEAVDSAFDTRSEGGVVDIPGSGFVLQDPHGNAYPQNLSVERRSDVTVRVLGIAGRESNEHCTGWDDIGLPPYSCVIEVLLEGDIGYVVSSPECPSSAWGDVPRADVTESLSAVLRIPVQTAWALDGVEYSPTHTVTGDALHILTSFAEPLLGPLTAVFQAADGAFDCLSMLMTDINSYVAETVQVLTDAILVPVTSMQSMLAGSLGSVIETFGHSLADDGTLALSLDLYGMELILETNIIDIALSSGSTMLKVTLNGNVGDTLMSVSVRLVRTMASEFVLIGTASMATDSWCVALTLDPLMKVYNHLAELKGTLEGVDFEVILPVVTQYKEFRVALSQIPGIGALLSNIPLPVPGMKGSIDAGFDIKYNLPFAGGLVINEFELNPAGVDKKNEWVEIFNPLSHSVNLAGWYITSGQAGKVYNLTSGTLAAGSRMMVRFPGQFLNNGGGTKIPQGESVKLWDPQGRMVDSTPWKSDYYNDGRTWQREYDGAEKWVFRDHTGGASNGKVSKSISSRAWLEKQIVDSVLQAYAELGNNMDGLDDLSGVLGRTIDLLIDRIVDTVAESVVESSLFIRVGVSDLSSSAHGGLELSLQITPDFIREGLRWMFDSIGRIVMNVGNPCDIARPDFLMEKINLRLSLFAATGTPKFLMTLEEDMTVEIQAMVECNLAALAGDPDLNRTMGFGLVLRGLPGASMPSFFSVDADRTADLWMARGYLVFPGNDY